MSGHVCCTQAGVGLGWAGLGWHGRTHQATAPRQGLGKAPERHEVSHWRGPGGARPSPVTRGDHSPSPTAIPALPLRLCRATRGAPHFQPRRMPPQLLRPAGADGVRAVAGPAAVWGRAMGRRAVPSKACSSLHWPQAKEGSPPVSGLQPLLRPHPRCHTKPWELGADHCTRVAACRWHHPVSVRAGRLGQGERSPVPSSQAHVLRT